MFPTRAMTILGGDSFRDEYSLAFDGTNDNIRIPEIEYDVQSSNVSFTYWAKRANADNVYAILGHTSYANQAYIRHIADGTVKIESDSNGDVANITPVSTDFNWHHYVIACSSGTVTAYQDGVACSVSGDVNGNVLTVDTIGGQSTGGVVYEWFGNISEIAVYNIALSSSQAKQIYNGREPFDHKDWAKTGNLTQWWRMGDGRLDDRNSEFEHIGDEVNPTIGSELVANGAFDTEVEGGNWQVSATSGANNWAISGGTMNHTDDGSNDTVQSRQTSVVTTGKIYKVSYDITAFTSGSVHVDLGDSGTGVGTTRTAVGSYSEFLMATNTFVDIEPADGTVLSVDNVSVKLVGGSSGVCINMDTDDFVGDTP